ncbi:hypothetical protein K523DRAFT_345956 [Schizophyllum commune Tattone D]|nr:hypothetical protein K523DRAFT_345956 [Schizophyllum commune Tattone D]
MSPPSKSPGSDRSSSSSQSPRSRWLPRDAPLPRDLQGFMSPPTQHTSMNPPSPYYASSEAGSSSNSSLSSSVSHSSRGSLAFIINEPERIGVTSFGSRQRAELALPPLEGGRHWVAPDMIERTQPAMSRSSPEDSSASTRSSTRSRPFRPTTGRPSRPAARRPPPTTRRQPPAPRSLTGPSHAPGRTPPRLISPGWGAVAGSSASTGAGPSASTSADAYASDDDAPIPNPKPQRKQRKCNPRSDVYSDSVHRMCLRRHNPGRIESTHQETNRRIAERVEAYYRNEAIGKFEAHQVWCICGQKIKSEGRNDFYYTAGSKHANKCWYLHTLSCERDSKPVPKELRERLAKERDESLKMAKPYLENVKEKCRCIELEREFPGDERARASGGPALKEVVSVASALWIEVGGRLQRITQADYQRRNLAEYIDECKRAGYIVGRSGAQPPSSSGATTEGVTMTVSSESTTTASSPHANASTTDSSAAVGEPSTEAAPTMAFDNYVAPSHPPKARGYADAQAWTGDLTWVEEHPEDEYDDEDADDVDENLETPYLDAALAEGWVPRWSRSPPSQHERLASESATSSSARESSSSSSASSSAPSSVEGPTPVQAGKKRRHDEMTRGFNALSVTVCRGKDSTEAISSISRIETKDNGRWRPGMFSLVVGSLFAYA